MHLPGISMNPIASAVSQVLSAVGGSASSSAKNVASNPDSASSSGAQSFFSALQQKLSLGTSAGTSSAALTQLGSDLSSGNSTGMQADLASLKSLYPGQTQGPTAPVAHNRNLPKTSLGQTNPSPGDIANPVLAELASYSALQQGAFAGAVNLSMPASFSTFSVNS
jgi:hypothetical protein